MAVSHLDGLIPLVDGDLVIYRCGFASKEPEPLVYTLHSVKKCIEGILEPFERRSEYKLFIDGPGNYRESVATIQPYKGNRDPSKVPMYKEEIKQYLRDYWNAQLVKGMETDDALGIVQTRSKDTCIVSIDKDMDCIAGWHYNWVKEEAYKVNQAQSNRWFWTQVLIGDDTDHILGCGVKVSGVYKTGKKAGQERTRREGVGPKEAESILDRTDGSWMAMYEAVANEYDKRGLGHASFKENATLCWILREPWINFDGSRLDGNCSGTVDSEEGSEGSKEVN